MKTKKGLIFAVFLAFGLIFSMPACKTGEGCDYGTEVDMDSSKRGKSNLFSKKTRKKMKKRGQ